ncbi:MAG: hypothetical protein ACM3SU_07680 [Acidobacteriota bacterium]
MEPATRFLASRAAPILFGFLTAIEIAFVWGSLDPVATVHDEAAYLLQAKVFARGHWTAPAAPLPEFFEQFHVLVTPVLAGKYPPGHSLLLAPGVWLGLPGLMPVVLAGIAGGLLFLLARRFANPWVALLTWVVWTTSPGNLRFLPGYFSQNTTIVLWLLGWWALADWLKGKGAGWLMFLSACVAWGVLTRPFTTVGYALAAAFVVLREILRRKAWRDLALALLPAAAVLAVIPVWSRATTGDALMTPYELYSKIYFPYQRPGFGLPAAAAPRRTLPPDMARYGEGYRAMHAAHTLASVPKDLADRAKGILNDTWGQSRWPLSLFAFLGLFVLPGPGVFALVSGVLLILCHIPFAHPWIWSLYYLELQAPLAFVTALGLWAVLSAVASRPRPMRREVAGSVSPGAAVGAALLVLAAAGPLASDVVGSRERHYIRMAYHGYFRSLVAAIPEPRAIVFVRYGPRHNEHLSLIANEPYLQSAKAWIVYDRGPDNARLMRRAPDRACYLYDEAAGALTRLQGGPPAPGAREAPPG